MAEPLATAPAFAVQELTDIALAAMIVRRGREAELAVRVGEAFDLELPRSPLRSAAGPLAFVWAGPDRWLATSEGEPGHRFEARLRAALGDLAAVSDQSDGRMILRISGPRARDVLAKGLTVDTHPRVMQPGAAVLSAIGQVGVHLWQVDEVPTYDCAVGRSYAQAFMHWINEASAEYRHP